MDDILIYAKDLEEHDRLVLEVLRCLREHHLTIVIEKCTWGVTEVEYLGYIIAEYSIAMFKEKVNYVLD
jgi:Reverse transcriptase (RNA-dependent DNA polymerase)